MAFDKTAHNDTDGQGDISNIPDGRKGSLPVVASDHERTPVAAAAASVAGSQPPLIDSYSNGYHFPPAVSWKVGFVRGCKAFWNYTWTPVGFFVVLYGLNVVAWGGMLFLLLVNAAPAMCYPSCNDINSPRRKWIEYTSQILNALFCVTGFGLAPWRFRDLYYLLKWRLRSRSQGLQKLAGFHRGWFRLPGSDTLPSNLGPDNIADYAAGKDLKCIPIPSQKIPKAPLTGHRAPPTRQWKLDFVIWFNVSNTFLQCCLAGFMWGLNRYDRPSWSTGLFVGLAMIAAAVAGIMMFLEGKNVKKVEGVPVTDEDLEQLARDKELGVVHYNNIKDKKPKGQKV